GRQPRLRSIQAFQTQRCCISPPCSGFTPVFRSSTCWTTAVETSPIFSSLSNRYLPPVSEENPPKRPPSPAKNSSLGCHSCARHWGVVTASAGNQKASRASKSHWPRTFLL